MQDLVQSDIFFLITSIAVVAVTIFVLIILWYLIRILKNIKDVSDLIKKEGVFIISDISGIRAKVKKILDTLLESLKKKTTRRRSKSKL